MFDGLARTFENCFLRIDEKIQPNVVEIKKKDFYFEIVVENAAISKSTEKLLSEYFGGISCTALPIENSQNVVVQVSRVKLPNGAYSFGKVSRYVFENNKLGWFLGMGSTGPVHLHPSQFTHFALFGTSGFGKSVMLKNLLAQTLAFQKDTVNLIVDFKKVDFQVLGQHPNVIGIVNDTISAKGMILALNVELSYRELIFSRAFSNPPVNLDEYRDFRVSFKRADLPDFPRMIVWIDEAKLFFHSEFENDNLVPLIRKGRAFGIHFVFASQRPVDIPTTFLSQVPESLTFFLNDYSGAHVNNEKMQAKEIKAIRGRFIYYNSNSDQCFEAHAPYLAGEEAAGVAFKFNSDRPKRGISRLKIYSDFMKNGYFARALASGISFDVALKLDAKQLEDHVAYMGRKTFNFDFSAYFDLLDPTGRVANTSGHNGSNPKASTPEKDELVALIEFFEDEEEKERQEKLKITSSAVSQTPNVAKLSGPVHDPLAVLEIKVSDNKKSITKLLVEFNRQFEKSTLDFSWVIRDLSENIGLQKIYDRKFGTTDVDNLKLNLRDFALDSETKINLEIWISSTRVALSEKRSFPFLILSGYPGYGKKTLTGVISRELGVPVRKATVNDLDRARKLKSNILQEISSEKLPQVIRESKLEVPELLIFDNLESAVTYSRHQQDLKGVICIQEFAKESFSWSDGPEKALRKELQQCSEPYLHIEFNSDYYTHQGVGDQLIKVLLEHKGFVGNLEEFGISTFAKTNIELNPGTIAKIIDRAKRYALFSRNEFNAASVHKVLAELRAYRNTKTSSGVITIEPKKGLRDLILNEEVRGLFLQVIERARSFGFINYSFAKKLRRGQRLVTLFHGEPGTGKSLSGEVLAYELGKELWLCEMSGMQSMFAGGTEKILSDLFANAQAAEVVLQLDEADAFLTNRQSVDGDYMKRIANHLLNLIENYQGILVLTTNNAEIMDPAFSRRIDTKILFKRPTEEAQVQILKSMLEPDAPLSQDIDFKKALKGLSLTGGLIRNAVERMITKMRYNSVDIITQQILEESLQEISSEEKSLEDNKQQIGIS